MKYRIVALIGLALLCTGCHKDRPQDVNSTIPGQQPLVMCHACGSDFLGVVCPHVVCN